MGGGTTCPPVAKAGGLSFPIFPIFQGVPIMTQITHMHVTQDDAGHTAIIECTDGNVCFELTGHGATHEAAVYSVEFDYRLGPHFWQFSGRELQPVLVR